MKNIIIDGNELESYFADEDGNLFYEYRGEIRPLTKFISWNGYSRVKLSKGIKRGMYLVHRIIAETFINNPNKFPIVNHKNNIRDDNRLVNLEWCNNSYNQKQRFKNRRGTKAKRVEQIDLETNQVLKVWETPLDVYKELEILNQNISKVCRGERRQAGGFGWRYVE